jgi:hypothetical protein
MSELANDSAHCLIQMASCLAVSPHQRYGCKVVMHMHINASPTTSTVYFLETVLPTWWMTH